MKLPFPATLGLVAAIPALSLLVQEDEIEFRPASGTSVTKTFEASIDLTLDEATAYVNGEEQDMGLSGEEAAFLRYDCKVTDEFAEMDGGRPIRLLRTIDEATAGLEVQPDGESEEISPGGLEGATILFRWEEDDDDYEVSFEEGGGDEQLLEFLAVDMDFARLLPEGSVSEDDTWEVSGLDFAGVLVPGIDLGHLAEEGIDVEGFPDEILEESTGFLDAVTATCTYEGTSDADGITVAEIAVKATISGSLELGTDVIGEEIPEGGIDISIELDLEGSLLWNLEKGHFHSFELEGDGILDAVMSFSIPDFDMEFEQNFSMSFTLELLAEAG